MVGRNRHGTPRVDQLDTALLLTPRRSETAPGPPKSLMSCCHMPVLSQIVTRDASPLFHNLCGDTFAREWQIVNMDGDSTDKNGGPNYLQQWREFRGLTQEAIAAKVGTNANMISYLEKGERGLSAKWLRRLAPILDTTPGMILDHDPHTMDADIIDIWATASTRQKRQISEIAKTIVKTGTDD